MSDTEKDPAAPAPEAASATEPFSLEKKAFLFNRFYFDLLKKIKNHAKQSKGTSKESRDILRAIKKCYSSYETGSTEHFEKLQKKLPASFWDRYYACPVEKVDAFLASEEAQEVFLYDQIHLAGVSSCVKDAFVIHHYLTIFAILGQEASQNDITRALEALKGFKTKDLVVEVQHITDKNLCDWVVRLHTIYERQVSNMFQGHLSDMESTSIGRLAKEIMSEVDVSSLQGAIENPSNIFQALADPNSGIASLLGTVSQKMIGKLTSGEIRQENLLEDAIKFASKLPGMVQGGATTGPMADLTNMASVMQTMMGGLRQEESDPEDSSRASTSSGTPGFDIGAITKMVQGMMGGSAGGAGGAGGIAQMVQNMMGNAGNAGGARAGRQAVNRSVSSQARRAAMAQKMRSKMDKRKAKENVPDQVE